MKTPVGGEASMRSRNAQREEAHQPPAESGIFPRSGDLRSLYILS